MEDRKIIDLLFAREERAVVAMREKYGRLLRQIAFNVLEDTEDALECENDTYLGAWRRIPPERPQHLSAYLCRIVRNTALKKYRDDHRKKRDQKHNIPLEELMECLSSENLETTWSAKHLGECINAWLATLDGRSRSLFLRRYWFGDSVKVLAREFGFSTNRVSVQLFRLRNELKTFLEKEGYAL
ncbi:MAG: sigma-70 family RNA polymerase sigma factor [Lachnospiraceae bacterium]|nr:sigma-70 family RNA polymerase sigma factor [Lachnospiraceae bacterium]